MGAAGSSHVGGAAPSGFSKPPCHRIIAWSTASVSSPACFMQLDFFFLGFLCLQFWFCLHTQPWLELQRRGTHKEQHGAAAPISSLALSAVEETTAAQVGLLNMEMAHKRPKTVSSEKVPAQESASLTAQGGRLDAGRFVMAVKGSLCN